MLYQLYDDLASASHLDIRHEWRQLENVPFRSISCTYNIIICRIKNIFRGTVLRLSVSVTNIIVTQRKKDSIKYYLPSIFDKLGLIFQCSKVISGIYCLVWMFVVRQSDNIKLYLQLITWYWLEKSALRWIFQKEFRSQNKSSQTVTDTECRF